MPECTTTNCSSRPGPERVVFGHDRLNLVETAPGGGALGETGQLPAGRGNTGPAVLVGGEDGGRESTGERWGRARQLLQ